jgi:hypothetical protein
MVFSRKNTLNAFATGGSHQAFRSARRNSAQRRSCSHATPPASIAMPAKIASKRCARASHGVYTSFTAAAENMAARVMPETA